MAAFLAHNPGLAALDIAVNPRAILAADWLNRVRIQVARMQLSHCAALPVVPETCWSWEQHTKAWIAVDDLLHCAPDLFK